MEYFLSTKRKQPYNLFYSKELWESGPDWRQNQNHPSHIWLKPGSDGAAHKSFAWFVITRTTTNFLARWPSPRYQAIVALFSAFVYVGLHVATVTNLDYTSDTPFAFEYAYYVFVASDLLLELFALLSHPTIYLKKPSSYFSLTAVGLLTASAITRFVALVIYDNFLDQHTLLTTSFFLLIFATPLMFFRLLCSWSADKLSWNVAKTNHIVTQCIVNSLWVFALSLLVIFSFWVTLGALQYDDIKPLNMLGLLTLGALQ